MQQESKETKILSSEKPWDCIKRSKELDILPF